MQTLLKREVTAYVHRIENLIIILHLYIMQCYNIKIILIMGSNRIINLQGVKTIKNSITGLFLNRIIIIIIFEE